MMFMQSGFEHVDISQEVRIKTRIIARIVVSRWMSGIISLKNRVLHLDVILESQWLACLLLICSSVVVVWNYLTHCVSTEFVLLGVLAVVCCLWFELLVNWHLGTVFIVVFVEIVGGFAVLRLLLLVEWVFILRNTLTTLRNTIVISAVLWWNYLIF